MCSFPQWLFSLILLTQSGLYRPTIHTNFRQFIAGLELSDEMPWASSSILEHAWAMRRGSWTRFQRFQISTDAWKAWKAWKAQAQTSRSTVNSVSQCSCFCFCWTLQVFDVLHCCWITCLLGENKFARWISLIRTERWIGVRLLVLELAVALWYWLEAVDKHG